jgi:ABC-type transport system involved in multi-copper enzyme maturation permease subunit
MQVNPVIRKELKTRMRGWKSAAMITAYTGFLALLVFLYFLANNQIISLGNYEFTPRIALNAYYMLAVVQLVLILLIAPIMTATAISSERERQTLDLMLCTEYSPLKIVIGKTAASLAHILLLITASLPVMSLVFLFGGIVLSDLLALFVFYLASALMVGSMGMFFSSIFRKSSISVIVTYISIFILMISPLILLLLYMLISRAYVTGAAPSPLALLLMMTPNPFFGFASLIAELRELWIIQEIYTELSRMMAQQNTSGFLSARPWILNVLFNLLMSAILILASSRVINPAKKPFRRRG